MGTASLERIQEDLAGLKQDVAQIKSWVREDWDVSEEADADVRASRKQPLGAMIDHEEMRAEFGSRGARLSGMRKHALFCASCQNPLRVDCS